MTPMWCLLATALALTAWSFVNDARRGVVVTQSDALLRATILVWMAAALILFWGDGS